MTQQKSGITIMVHALRRVRLTTPFFSSFIRSPSAMSVLLSTVRALPFPRNSTPSPSSLLCPCSLSSTTPSSPFPSSSPLLRQPLHSCRWISQLGFWSHLKRSSCRLSSQSSLLNAQVRCQLIDWARLVHLHLATLCTHHFHDESSQDRYNLMQYHSPLSGSGPGIQHPFHFGLPAG